MTLAAGDVADVVEIQQLIARYPDIVDGREFDRLGELFTADARIDFTAFGGPVDNPAGIVGFLRDSLAVFRRTQHMMGLPHITVEGDHAHARTSCTNPMVVDNPDGTTSVWLIGLWYDDDLVRTPTGWRIAARRQERCYSVLGLTDTPLGPA